jgi:hypothetical protein
MENLGLVSKDTIAHKGNWKQAKDCPRCGYRLSNFRIQNRCFNCDYQERGSDGPRSDGAFNQGLIWQAESIWEGSDPFFENEYKHDNLYGYLKQRRIFGLASNCDQLRARVIGD